MRISLWGPLRLVLLVLVLFAVYNLLSFARNQSRFQKFLDTQFITWDDFPPEYSDVLRTHKEEQLLPDTYDYSKSFPPAGANKDHIPPTIHFIWYQNLYETRPEVTKIPSKGSDAPDLCRKYNPEWEVKVWNATAGRELIETHYSWFLPTYDAYKHPIQRVDALKYAVLYHYGGVYMDMDIACRRPLEPLLQFPAWFPEASPLGVNNDLMATRAHHPVIMAMLRNLGSRNKNLIFPYLTIFWSTGPQFTSDLLKSWFLGHPAPTYTKGASKANADPEEWFVLPQVFYSEEYTFFGHSPGGTWHGDDVAVVLWFVAHPVLFWGLVATLLAVACCGPFLLRRRIRQRQRQHKAGMEMQEAEIRDRVE